MDDPFLFKLRIENEYIQFISQVLTTKTEERIMKMNKEIWCDQW